MRIYTLTCVISILLLLLILVSCDTDTVPLGAVPVTPEMLESVSRSLAEQSTSDVPIETQLDTTGISSSQAITAESSVSVDAVQTMDEVYWTEGGTVYHLRDTCSALKKSKEIFHGTIEEALSARKERACKTCS